MITATLILGGDAVRQYNTTGQIPSLEWLMDNGGVVKDIEFPTKAEYAAYIQGVSDAHLWVDYRVIPKTAEESQPAKTIDIRLLTPQEQQKNLSQDIIDSLCRTTERPDGWLPHIVFVEEEGDYPVYTMYKLEEIRQDGSCVLFNPQNGERFYDRHLYEINIDWLITVWNWYVDLSIEQKIWKDRAVKVLLQNSDADEMRIREFVDEHWQNLLLDKDNIKAFKEWLSAEKEPTTSGQYAFVWNCCHLDRNVSDKALIEAWQNGPSRSVIDEEDKAEYEVERLTLDELAERINDECFNDNENYIRFIPMND